MEISICYLTIQNCVYTHLAFRQGGRKWGLFGSGHGICVEKVVKYGDLDWERRRTPRTKVAGWMVRHLCSEYLVHRLSDSDNNDARSSNLSFSASVHETYVVTMSSAPRPAVVVFSMGPAAACRVREFPERPCICVQIYSFSQTIHVG